MLGSPRFWSIAANFPFLFRGPALYRAALAAAAEREFAEAELLFERAAADFRRDLRVPELARLRVRQLMTRFESVRAHDPEAALDLAAEIERRLRSLDWIEDVSPPFDEVSAADLLVRWQPRVPERARALAA